MMKDIDIPDIVIRRLPIYARSLSYLSSEGITTVSSSELGARIGVTAAQIRRDLSYFGEFGKQGKGYNVQFLLNQIRDILHLEQQWGVALVGTGHLGEAIAHYGGFLDKGSPGSRGYTGGRWRQGYPELRPGQLAGATGRADPQYRPGRSAAKHDLLSQP